jgi:hypothetical protein
VSETDRRKIEVGWEKVFEKAQTALEKKEIETMNDQNYENRRGYEGEMRKGGMQNMTDHGI